ncbi:conserved exported hypothetical protein [Mesorhizobium prunaredense]|uniref:Uncharacterized protein n=1 Tax=Mesorhizobium prunaredense TaxID=1631249 RepID=A0A1R3VAS6_9HYPH|nr:conserved exported hypothetical protein [Mesorhizobium prunaredense]
MILLRANGNGKIMRMLTTIAVLLALGVASPVYAQSPGAQLPPDVTQAPATLCDQTSRA